MSKENRKLEVFLLILSEILAIGVVFGLVQLVGWGSYILLSVFTFMLPMLLLVPLFVFPFLTGFISVFEKDALPALIMIVNFINLFIIISHFKNYKMDMVTEAGVDKILLNPTYKWIGLISAILLVAVNFFLLFDRMKMQQTDAEAAVKLEK
jgi:hypothetical protein